MQSDQRQCPGLDHIKQFSGDLSSMDPPTADLVCEHLDNCPNCRQKVFQEGIKSFKSQWLRRLRRRKKKDEDAQ